MKKLCILGLAASISLISGCVVAPAQPVPVQVGAMVRVAPPPLPVYDQPMAPAPGYLWTPGYWDWGGVAYYWVPGVWVLPPQAGLLWTPGWWGFADGGYRWHRGYWAQEVGFYGGINYGFGYFGIGFSGGVWRGGDFYYNRAVSNVNITNIRNVYVDRTVVQNRATTINPVSYNGGAGGVALRPTAEQRALGNERHFAPTDVQMRHRDQAVRAPEQRFDARGRPAVFATPHTGRAVDVDAPAPRMQAPGMAPQSRPDARRPDAMRPAPVYRGDDARRELTVPERAARERAVEERRALPRPGERRDRHEERER